MNNCYKFPMCRYEQIIGCIYIPVHALLVPRLLSLIYIKLLLPAGITVDAAYLNLIYYAFSFLFVLCTMFRYLKRSFSDFFDNTLNSLSAIVLGYAGYMILSIIFSLAISFIENGTVNPNSETVNQAVKLNSNVMLVVSVLLAPIVEETLFRGALFGTIRKKSRLLAYIVTIIIFGLYHIIEYMILDFNWMQLVYVLQYAPASLALCWSYERSGSIWSPIIIHAVINCISVTVQLG